MTFAPLGDGAVVVTLGSGVDEATIVRVRSLTAALGRATTTGIVDVVPAYASVTVFYDPQAFGGEDVSAYEAVCALIGACAEKTEHAWPDLVKVARGSNAVNANEPDEFEIPVWYGGETGPDLADVAQHCGLSADDVIELHSGARYVVHAVGFTPGFPYLGGLPKELQTPRRATPRVRVPAGSVGIGWKQTGIYPIASPGGWQLIGRTPLALFDATRTPPAMFRVGDHVRFRRITPEEFASWK